MDTVLKPPCHPHSACLSCSGLAWVLGWLVVTVNLTRLGHVCEGVSTEVLRRVEANPKCGQAMIQSEWEGGVKKQGE